MELKGKGRGRRGIPRGVWGSAPMLPTRKNPLALRTHRKTDVHCRFLRTAGKRIWGARPGRNSPSG
jgi:hypothetical protein